MGAREMMRVNQFAGALPLGLLVLLCGCGGGGSPTTSQVQPRNALATVSSISPQSTHVGDPSFSLTIRGSGFLRASIVNWNGQARPTTFVSASELIATIPDSDVAQAGEAAVTVVNPPPGGGRSTALLFTVAAGFNDTCQEAVTLDNERITASLSPYGDLDVYSFEGTQGNLVTIETFAERLELDFDSMAVPSFADTVVELLDSKCAPLKLNNDLESGMSIDSLIQNFPLPTTGKYFIRVRDFRGDGRPDLIYDLQLSGAN